MTSRTRPAWTPEDVIEQQRETILRLTERLRRAEKMVDVLARRHGRLRAVHGLTRDVLDQVEAERDHLAFWHDEP